MRELHVSRRVLVAGAMLTLLFVIGGLLAPQLTMRTRRQADRLAELELENRRLWGERSEFETSLSEMQAQLSSFETHAQRLAEELGLDGQSTREPAAGGPTSVGAARFWFDGELSGLRSRTERLGTSLQELDDAFAQRARALAAVPSTRPVDGWFSHGFGWRQDPWTGEREFHYGLDIVAKTGASVRAAADGVVSQATRSGNYGKVVELDHGHGYVTRYAHLSEFGVAAGDEIRRGEEIGRVGSTGRSTGPHLHYEVFRNGKRVNPWLFLAER